MDNATKIYSTLMNGKEAALQRLIDESRIEDQYLDFKQVTKKPPPLQDEDKRNLAKTVGSFANADSGVIVWGVDCRKNADGLDVAIKRTPIERIDQFKTALDEVTPQLVQPYPNVTHSIIYSAEPGFGYVVTLVPLWEGLPVRSILAGKGSDFYLRTGNQISQMPPSLLAERFGRRPLPKLRVTGAMIKDQTGQAWLKLAVHNYGRGLAKSIAVLFSAQVNLPYSERTWSIASGYEQTDELFQQQGICFESPYEMVIYPGLGRKFYHLNTHASLADEVTQQILQYQIFCDGYSYKGSIKAVQDTSDLNRFTFQEVD